jgi:hypothetical protein
VSDDQTKEPEVETEGDEDDVEAHRFQRDSAGRDSAGRDSTGRDSTGRDSTGRDSTGRNH